MRVLGFAGSNSSASLNKRLVTYVVSQISADEKRILDLNDYEMPLYGIDRQNSEGFPDLAARFKEQIKWADKIVISFAEHNGSYSVAFKNIMDWISRLPGDTWESKPYFLMSTSPGRRGGRTVLDTATATFGHMGAQVAAHFSLPSFGQNFDDEKGILDDELKSAFEEQLSAFEVYNPDEQEGT